MHITSFNFTQTYTLRATESGWGKKFQTLISTKTGKKASESPTEITEYNEN